MTSGRDVLLCQRDADDMNQMSAGRLLTAHSVAATRTSGADQWFLQRPALLPPCWTACDHSAVLRQGVQEADWLANGLLQLLGPVWLWVRPSGCVSRRTVLCVVSGTVLHDPARGAGWTVLTAWEQRHRAGRTRPQLNEFHGWIILDDLLTCSRTVCACFNGGEVSRMFAAAAALQL